MASGSHRSAREHLFSCEVLIFKSTASRIQFSQTTKRSLTTLLEETTGYPTSVVGQIFQSGRRGWGQKPTHANSVESSDGEEGAKGGAEGGAEFEDDEHHQVADEDPLAAVPIANTTRNQRSNGAKHERDRDAPGDGGRVFSEVLSDLSYCSIMSVRVMECSKAIVTYSTSTR